MFITRDRESRNVIDEFNTLKEAQIAIEQYESDDRLFGEYTPDFYEIVEVLD